MLCLRQLPWSPLRPTGTVFANRSVRCSALPEPHLMAQLQQEVTIEGVLHVSALQSSSCMQDFRDLQALQLSAPGLVAHEAHSVQDVLQAAEAPTSSNITARMARTALCLATPEDSIEEEEVAIAQPRLIRGLIEPSIAGVQTAGRVRASNSFSFTSSSSLRAPALASSSAASTTVAWQATELYGCEHTVSVLQAAAGQRRQRRRALISALRAGRDAMMQLVDYVAGTVVAGCRVLALGMQANRQA